MATSNRVEDKLDIISAKISSIDLTLAAQHISLEQHIKRTNLLEEEIKPVKKHVDMMNGAAKLLSFIAMTAAIIEAIHMVFK
jgi:transposase-like protein